MMNCVKRIGAALKGFFVTDGKSVIECKSNRVDIYIRTADINHEHSVHYKHLMMPDFDDLCRIFNFLPDNKHEGLGWWERVEMVLQRGLTEDEVAAVIDERVDDDKQWTYVPEEILMDLEKAHQHEIGFAPRGEDKNDPNTRVVWFHLID